MGASGAAGGRGRPAFRLKTFAGRRLWMGQILTSSEAAVYPATVDSAQVAAVTDAAPLPATVEMAFAPVTDPAAATAYTWQLAHEHYENFSVVSVLLPRSLRQDFCNVYAF